MSDEPGKRPDMPVNSDPPSFDAISEFIRTVSELMREFGLISVDVETTDTRIRLRTPASSSPVAHRYSSPVNRADPSADAAEPPADEVDYIFAPMIGTFYSASGPGEPEFVEPGDEIEIGQTIGIIEAMKILNEIAADRAGVVQEVLVRNAQAVEYGQPLLRLSPPEGA